MKGEWDETSRRADGGGRIVRVARRRLHRGWRYRRAAAVRRSERGARPGDAGDVDPVQRGPRGGRRPGDLRRLRGGVPVDHDGCHDGCRGRREGAGRDQGRHPARRDDVVGARRSRGLLRHRRMAGPHSVHRAGRHGGRGLLPAVGRALHGVRREAVRVPVPHGRGRPVLQQGPAGGEGVLRAAHDLFRAHGDGEGPHRVQPRRLDQGRGLRALVRELLRQRRPAEPLDRVGRRLVQRRRHRGDRPRTRTGPRCSGGRRISSTGTASTS